MERQCRTHVALLWTLRPRPDVENIERKERN